jgi:signal peptidase I
MGDNRENSNDSRFTGAVSLRQLKGKATLIYLSWGPEGIRWERIGRRLDR